ncbi:hypothetical protein KR032_005212 [Drosophila birchii]|nr:hypothetical protein KR032_005212 [Drosophila birchii]
MQINYIQFDILVILATLRYGNANYLGTPRSRDRNLNKENAVKTDNNPGGVRAVGEVFVPKTFSLNSQEPTCEQLRAMWIFSKRQSRAAEITNEIPTYRDPFTYNVWEPLYLNSRMQGSLRMGGRERSRSPVFGRVVSREPSLPQRMQIAPSEHQQRERVVEFGLGNPPPGTGISQTRFYGSEIRPQNGISSASSSRRSNKNRYMGGVPNESGGIGTNIKDNQNSVAIQGSFQKLKELIWTERAKELTQQRRDEEMAARAAALKEIANGKNIFANNKPPTLSSSSSESIMMDQNRSPDGDSYQFNNNNANRMSILNEQSLQSDKVNNKNSQKTGSRATTRRIGASGSVPSYNAKSKFSGRYGNIGQLNQGVTTGRISSDIMAEKDHSTIIGIPRTYPIRKSHFRERNRSLFKEPQDNNYFRRFLRGLSTSPFHSEINRATDKGNNDVGRQLYFLDRYNYNPSPPNYENYLEPIENDNIKQGKIIPESEHLEDEFSDYGNY